MPRGARVVVPGITHHVTQRGHRGEDVFFTDRDRGRFLRLLSQYSRLHKLDIWAYCLMTNHVHLVVVPQSESALASTLKPVHLRYAQHVNRTRGVTGRIWHGRFYSCPLDDVHTQAAMRYVEMNPVRARLVRRAEDYTWSSAPAHCGLRPDPLLADISGLRCSAGIEDWSAWLGSGLDDETLKHLRLHSRTGRPLGSDSFVDRLERLSSRVLRPRRAGRPRGRKSG